MQKIEESKKQDKEEEQRMNDMYSMGYLKWYTGKYGLWKTYCDWFSASMSNKIVTAIFFNMGCAFGYFMMKKEWLPMLCEKIKFP